MIPLLIRRVRSSPITLLAIIVIIFFLYQGWQRQGTTRFAPNGETYPPLYSNRLPDPQAALTLPKLQVPFSRESAAEKTKRKHRQAAVRERFVQTWQSYKENAYGADELQPLSGKAMTAFGGWGATLVDSLDSLWLLGMKEEFDDAVRKAADINFAHTEVEEINVFETTIRYLGGFLGAYDISGQKYPILLQKAIEIGDLVYQAFDTPNRMPITRWKLHNGPQQKASSQALLAEIGSLNLELTRLSQITGDSKYYDAVYRIAKSMDEAQRSTKLPGLWPIIINAEKLNYDFDMFGIGGMADSAYEYLPKMHMLIGGADDLYQRDYERAIQAARTTLFHRPMLPDNADILISGTVKVQNGLPYIDSQGQHLSCFAGGMLLMGSKLFPGRDDDFDIGRKLTEGCIWAYDSMPSGIMPEVFHMLPCKRKGPCEWSREKWLEGVLARQGDQDELKGMSAEEKIDLILSKQGLLEGYTSYDDTKYMLRPEAIESVFILYRMTGEEKYTDTAWRMWEAIDKATRTDIAHAGIHDVTSAHPQQYDKMESFWLAETLKYFYLIFSDPEWMSLDRYVLNTEAHPFLRPGAKWRETMAGGF